MDEQIYQLTDFPNDAVAPGKLQDEIIAAGLTTITNINCSISAPGVGTVDIFFSTTLTAPQIATLDGVVAVHDGVPLDLDLSVSGTVDSTPVTASGIPYTNAV